MRGHVAHFAEPASFSVLHLQLLRVQLAALQETHAASVGRSCHAVLCWGAQPPSSTFFFFSNDFSLLLVRIVTSVLASDARGPAHRFCQLSRAA